MKKGLTVNVKPHAHGFEQALRKFKKKVEQDGKLKTLRSKESFISKSDQKKIDKKRAISRHKKKLRDERKNLDKWN